MRWIAYLLVKQGLFSSSKHKFLFPMFIWRFKNPLWWSTRQWIILALGTNCGLLKGKAGVPCPLTTCQACSVRVLIRCSYFHHYLSFPTFWGCSDNAPPRRKTLCMLTSPHRFPCFLPEPHNKNHGTCLHWAAAIAAQTHSSPSTVLCLHLRSYCSLHSCCLLLPHPTWLLVFLCIISGIQEDFLVPSKTVG